MKPFFMKSMQNAILLGSVMSVSTGLIGCQNQQNTSTATSNQILGSESNLNLGTLQGELRLPQDQECFSFTAYQVGQEGPLFSVDVEQARVRNNQYSFLHSLPEGEYQVRGTLSCISEDGPVEYDSLYDDVVINSDQISEVQLRFFFDVESDLNQVDLKFCADLMLQHLQPAVSVCVGEEVIAEHQVDWHLEDCGSVELVMALHQEEGISASFAFPQDRVETRLFAPNQLGQTELIFSVQSSLGDRIELSREPMEIIDCSDEEPTDFEEVDLCFDTHGREITEGVLDGSNFIIINGQKISGFFIQDHDQGGTLRDAINDITDLTGVRSGLNAFGGLHLQSQGPIHVGFEGDAGETTGLDQLEINQFEGICEEI
jgi:hypothetical protein